MRILITGVPGTGKTTIGNYLQDKHGYFHVDMERDNFEPTRVIRADTEAFLAQYDEHENCVFTWGFSPVDKTDLVQAVVARGYTPIWLDGDRVASLRHFLTRENNDPVMEEAYYQQLKEIMSTGIIQTLGAVCLNPYDDAGEFKAADVFAEEVLRAAQAK